MIMFSRDFFAVYNVSTDKFHGEREKELQQCQNHIFTLFWCICKCFVECCIECFYQNHQSI